jgi:hypothetical protein
VTLDLTGVQAQVGHEVVVSGAAGGKAIGVEEMARWLGCGPLDVLM